MQEQIYKQKVKDLIEISKANKIAIN